MDRFNDESLQFEHISGELVIFAFINGLHSRVLNQKLAQNTLKTIADLLQRVDHYQKGEDVMRRKRENDKKGADKSKASSSARKSAIIHVND